MPPKNVSLDSLGGGAGGGSGLALGGAGGGGGLFGIHGALSITALASARDPAQEAHIYLHRPEPPYHGPERNRQPGSRLNSRLQLQHFRQKTSGRQRKTSLRLFAILRAIVIPCPLSVKARRSEPK
jgi:hypothetical protein